MSRLLPPFRGVVTSSIFLANEDFYLRVARTTVRMLQPRSGQHRLNDETRCTLFIDHFASMKQGPSVRSHDTSAILRSPTMYSDEVY
ncbi:hypothetical protein RRG08_007618 [Elysia crispata]|uniref:Uncharacterized protein n=1 Tax=Elysia crispata TaxID=231223 RepID=A0AAE1AI60_9GAST|nr:hypothetical protein RRG08_007618 [Elysia crispata]